MYIIKYYDNIITTSVSRGGKTSQVYAIHAYLQYYSGALPRRIILETRYRLVTNGGHTYIINNDIA